MLAETSFTINRASSDNSAPRPALRRYNAAHRTWWGNPMRPLLSILILIVCPAAMAQDISPGQWELNVQTQAGGSEHSQVLKQCLTEADARDPGKLLVGSGSAAMGCALSDQRRSSGHIDFSVSCGAPAAIGGRGSVDFTPTTIDGAISLEFRGSNAMPGGFSSRLTGRRVGSC